MKHGHDLKRAALRLVAATTGLWLALPAFAHHSAAGYDLDTIEVLTGVVDRIYPGASHVEIFFIPLTAERSDFVRDADGKPVVWSVEMEGATAAAREGISGKTFPRNTIFSIALHPQRDGKPAGLKVRGTAVVRCPGETLPAPARHCDAVEGHATAGAGALPAGAER